MNKQQQEEALGVLATNIIQKYIENDAVVLAQAITKASAGKDDFTLWVVNSVIDCLKTYFVIRKEQKTDVFMDIAVDIIETATDEADFQYLFDYFSDIDVL